MEWLSNFKKGSLSFLQLLRQSLDLLLRNDPLRMAGATAFFTTFALPPILVILIQVLKLILDPVTVRQELFGGLSGIVGEETVDQIREVLRALRSLAHNWWIIVGGFIFLLFVATTLFKVIKGSINQLWKIRPKHQSGFVKTISSRGQSVLVILLTGILFVFGLFTEGVQAFVSRYIFEFSPLLSFYFKSIASYVFSIFMVTVWFAILFRFLPDGRPVWQVSFVGGLLTAVLFTIGKIVLRWLLSYSNINTLYGTSTSIVLLLLFVFYSALILYFGASFTKVWAMHKELPIQPLPNAAPYKITETEV